MRILRRKKVKLFIKATILTSLILSFHTFGGENDSNLAELMYLTPAGQFRVDSFFSSRSLRYTNKNDYDISYTEVSKSHFSIDESVSFGLIDNVLDVKLDFGAALAGIKKSTPSNTISSSVSEIKYNGFYDTGIQFKYRALNSSDSFANFDIFSGFKMGLEKRKNGDIKNEGNVASGGEEVLIGMEIGNSLSSFSWAVGLKFHKLFKQVVSDTSGSDVQELSARNNFEGYVNGKFYIWGENSIDFGLGVLSQSAYDETLIASASEIKLGSVLDIQIKSGFNFMISPSFAISPRVKYTFGGDRSISTKLAYNRERIKKSELDVGIAITFGF